MHYKRWWRHGSIYALTRLPASTNAEDRLKHFGWIVTESGCWEWSGYRDAAGYGTVGDGNKGELAHRIAYETWVGSIPQGKVVRHVCDNPPCINPDHLRAGTQIENMEDMTSRDRFYSKLTRDDVVQIRERYSAGGITHETLGKEFGVSGSNISRIVNRKGWKHV